MSGLAESINDLMIENKGLRAGTTRLQGELKEAKDLSEFRRLDVERLKAEVEDLQRRYDIWKSQSMQTMRNGYDLADQRQVLLDKSNKELATFRAAAEGMAELVKRANVHSYGIPGEVGSNHDKTVCVYCVRLAAWSKVSGEVGG